MASPTVVSRDAGPTPAVGATATQALTLGSVTAGALVALIGIMSGGAPVTVSGVAYDPTGANLPFTFFGRTQEAAGQFGDVEIWYLLSPPAGTFNTVATFSGSVVNALGFLYAQDVNQSTPWRATAQSTTGTGTTASTAVTTASGDLSLDATMFDDFHNLTIGAAPQTSITTRNNAVGSFSFGASDKTAAGATTTNSWTDGTSAPWIQVCGALQGTGGGGGRSLFYRSGLDGHSASGPKQFNPSLGYHRTPAISLAAYQREQARKHRAFMAKVRAA